MSLNAKPIELALQTLIGRDPSAEEVAKFYKIKDFLGFSEHDSVWAFLLAFGHYEIIYTDISKTIFDNTRQLLADHKLSLDAAADAAERSVRQSLSIAVSAAAKEALEEGRRIGATSSPAIGILNSKARIYGAIAGAVCISILMVSLGLHQAYSAGERAGLGQAGIDAAWATSEQGRAAKRFVALNPIQIMMDCPGNFQRREERAAVYCIPYDEKSKLTSGWRIK